ncbi:hypothetical protein OBP_232 [Pseudomonas phage OBP]|uniref:hypothetical protein n=1 Tax=Pseudomonas phage OBP TaxID=1124849 RepID=UPI000240D5CC|nr:hypothetical protein OBP_232 [Pseudomonas phage OBP]AEV89669.1 hypothetical protein OBP_232 [Pseudomonas phage OBP]
MKTRNGETGISKRFKWISGIYTVIIIAIILYILAADWLNYAANPTLIKYHDNLLFPLWVLMVGYEFGVRRTYKKLTARWKH